jgi:hypothetical protein
VPALRRMLFGTEISALGLRVTVILMVPPALLKGTKRAGVFKDPTFATLDTLPPERLLPRLLVIALVPILALLHRRSK